MASTFVITLDGVLRNPHTQAVNLQGIRLYRALASTGRLAVLCGPDEARDKHFLAQNGLTEHAYLVPESLDAAPTNSGRRMAQITYLRRMQCHIECVVEPDPDVAAELLSNGVAVLVYLHPVYTQPSFRPDYKNEATPWNNLVQEVDYQLAMRTAAALSITDQDD
jgi:hypothetical protein